MKKDMLKYMCVKLASEDEDKKEKRGDWAGKVRVRGWEKKCRRKNMLVNDVKEMKVKLNQELANSGREDYGSVRVEKKTERGSNAIMNLNLV